MDGLAPVFIFILCIDSISGGIRVGGWWWQSVSHGSGNRTLLFHVEVVKCPISKMQGRKILQVEVVCRSEGPNEFDVVVLCLFVVFPASDLPFIPICFQCEGIKEEIVSAVS
jgi:hypothetical protein